MPDASRAQLYSQLCLEKYKIRLMKAVDRLAERADGNAVSFFQGIAKLLHDELGCRLSWIGDGFGNPLFGAEGQNAVPAGKGAEQTQRRVLLHYYDDAQTTKCALYLLYSQGSKQTSPLPDSASVEREYVEQGRAQLVAAMHSDETLFASTMAEVLDTAGFDNFIRQTTTRQEELSTCVGGELAELIMRHGISSRALRPARKYMGYLFADVCGYTSFAAANSSEVVMDTINKFLAGAVKIVNRYPNSMLDKYVGDCLVVLVGALQDEDACAAHLSRHDEVYAREGVELARELMRFARRQGFELSVGFHVGEGHAGFVGRDGDGESCNDRLDFTAIGRNMNFASRLQDVADNNSLLVSRDVRAQFTDDDALLFESREREFKNMGLQTVFSVDWKS